MQAKKITVSHLTVLMSDLILIGYVTAVLYFIYKHYIDVTVPIATILGGLGTVIAGSNAIVKKSYHKKSDSENQIKLQVYLVQSIIDLQVKYPWLNLLASQDVNKILDTTKTTLQKSSQKNVENVVLEDISK